MKANKKQLLDLRYNTEYEDGPVGHDAIIKGIIHLGKLIYKEDVANKFLSSLATRTLHIRSAIGSFAVSKKIFEHDFSEVRGAGNCEVCGLFKSSSVNKKNKAGTNVARHDIGAVYYESLSNVYIDIELYLQRLNTAITNDEIKNGKRVFISILNRIKDMSQASKPSDIVKCIRGMLPSNGDERRALVEILGVCGILQPQEHPSLFDGWINAIERQQRRQFKSDWPYPVQWWRGKDGVNAKAVRFWFPELNWK